MNYELRRARSEVHLLEAMRYEKPKPGTCYNFITHGDVDKLTYLKMTLNWHSLDYLLLSTWVISAEDVLQIREWIDDGRIKRMDFYLGEIFPNQYKVEFSMIKRMYQEIPGLGRVVFCRNHCKVLAGYNENDGFWFASTGSANVNTNPRMENETYMADRSVFEFYKEFFDGIRSF